VYKRVRGRVAGATRPESCNTPRQKWQRASHAEGVWQILGQVRYVTKGIGTYKGEVIAIAMREQSQMCAFSEATYHGPKWQTLHHR